MPGKPYKEMIAFLDERGFVYDRTNSKGFEFYTHPGCRDVSLTTNIEDHAVKKLRVMVQRDLGEPTARDLSKRDVATVKERRAGDRLRAAEESERHERLLTDLRDQRDRQLGGIGAVLSESSVSAIVRQIESAERELHYWQSLMTGVPGDRADAGRPRARHRS